MVSPGSNVFAIVGKIIRELAVERQLAALDQLHDQGGRELLAHGAKTKLRLRRIGNRPLQVSHPVALAQDDLPMLGHKH